MTPLTIAPSPNFSNWNSKAILTAANVDKFLTDLYEILKNMSGAGTSLRTALQDTFDPDDRVERVEIDFRSVAQKVYIGSAIYYYFKVAYRVFMPNNHVVTGSYEFHPRTERSKEWRQQMADAMGHWLAAKIGLLYTTDDDDLRFHMTGRGEGFPSITTARMNRTATNFVDSFYYPPAKPGFFAEPKEEFLGQICLFSYGVFQLISPRARDSAEKLYYYAPNRDIVDNKDATLEAMTRLFAAERYYDFEEIFPVVADMRNGKWDFSRNPLCESVELTLNMRDGKFKLHTRRGQPLTLEELRMQVPDGEHKLDTPENRLLEKHIDENDPDVDLGENQTGLNEGG